MKSTDMFPSEEERMIASQPVIISPHRKPGGLAPSPFVISLWEEEKIPTAKSEEIHDSQLQSIEDLFRGNGRIDPSPYESSTPSSHIFSPLEEHTPQQKQIVIPSREEQIKKAQHAKNEYAAVFQKPSSSQGGFFRNFAFWK